MARSWGWLLTILGVAVILLSLTVAAMFVFGFVLCASTGSSCGGGHLGLELAAVMGAGSVIGVALVVAGSRVGGSRTRQAPPVPPPP